ncbi:C-8 sterol isomerase [Colletotrichum orchidophilum]|uniref:C-8 sterol isomerase n=1 Tax=Colletotrichum orchidophilum TaxID=1209926 RepID=A0A1G4B5V4_9PEZI|nr:C-8 sterol isomerase [Colletotrichum orchidophilum]OHE96791.1 C-8 sterol isomerase [Colletotrichum orchidophilum]
MPSLGRLFTLALWIGLLTPIYLFLEKNLEKFYIFDHEHLHDLSKRAIAAHGNDTRSVVNYIVTELNGIHPTNVNLDEEWVFNNAGGAMGAMYIIHASITEYLIVFGTTLSTQASSSAPSASDSGSASASTSGAATTSAAAGTSSATATRVTSIGTSVVFPSGTATPSTPVFAGAGKNAAAMGLAAVGMALAAF